MVKNIRKYDDLKRSFKTRPSGLTPITTILTKVLKNNMPNDLNDKKLLTIIVTDGEPTSSEGNLIKNFLFFLIQPRKKIKKLYEWINGKDLSLTSLQKKALLLD